MTLKISFDVQQVTLGDLVTFVNIAQRAGVSLDTELSIDGDMVELDIPDLEPAPTPATAQPEFQARPQTDPRPRTECHTAPRSPLSDFVGLGSQRLFRDVSQGDGLARDVENVIRAGESGFRQFLDRFAETLDSSAPESKRDYPHFDDDTQR